MEQTKALPAASVLDPIAFCLISTKTSFLQDHFNNYRVGTSSRHSPNFIKGERIDVVCNVDLSRDLNGVIVLKFEHLQMAKRGLDLIDESGV